jgi:hypothetical protein
MNFYKDLDDSEEDDTMLQQKGVNNQVKKNTFVFESFSERLKKIKVKLSTNYNNDISFLKMEKSDNLEYSGTESNFLIMYNREKVLNPSPEFTEFSEQLKPYIKSFFIMINNSQKLIEIFSATIKKQLVDKNFPFLISVLDILTGFIKDIREDAYELFIYTILPSLTELLLSNENVEVIDKVFAVLVNVFKFFAKVLNNDNNFEKFFMIYSELIFNKNKSIRRFANESICFLIKNFEKNDLTNRMKIMFQVFKEPAKYFKQDENALPQDTEMIEADKSFLRFNEYLEHLILINYSDPLVRQYYSFIIDCLSDLLVEILMGVNKNISIKADLFCERIKSDSDINFIKNIVMISTFTKLFIKVDKNNKKSIISLLHHYFLLDNPEYNVSFPKLNMDNLNNQLNMLTVNKDNSMLLLLFIKELIVKNFSSLEKTIVQYLISLLFKITKEPVETNLLILVSEIVSLLVKFYPDLFMPKLKAEVSFMNFLAESFNNSNLLRIFLQNLKCLQTFTQLLSFSFFDLRRNYRIESNPYYKNEEYDNSYDENIIHYVFDYLLNNISLEINSILDLLTTYEIILSNQDELNINEQFTLIRNNKELALTLTNESVINNVLAYYNDNTKANERQDNIASYCSTYSALLLLNIVKDKVDKTKIKNLFLAIINHLSHNIDDTALMTGSDNNLFNILFSEFNLHNKLYICKTKSFLQLFEYFVNEYLEILDTDNDSALTKDLIHLLFDNYCYQHTFSIINLLRRREVYTDTLALINNNEEFFIKKYSNILLSSSSSEKCEYLAFISEFNSLVDYTEILTLMSNTLGITFDIQNDRKHLLNYEILISKLEFIPLTEKTVNLYIVIYNFLLGSYWIRYVKSLWPSLTKNIEKYLSFVNSGSNNTVQSMVLGYIANNTNNIIHLIKTIGSNEDFISRFNKQKISEKYFIFNEENSEEFNTDDFTMKNIISINFFNKRDKLLNISLFYDGFFQSLQSYDKLLSANKTFFCEFIEKVFYPILGQQKQDGLEQHGLKEDEAYFICIFKNYINDKEYNTGSLSKKLYENILLILSNLQNSVLLEINKDKLKSVLYKYLVVSKSQLVQKYIITILTNLDDRLKNFKKLLETIIENTGVIERLYNLENTTNDSGQLMKDQEREALVPLITRLYYSKFFYITDDTKKLKTKNKINLVSYFIQLKENEFNEYVDLIFEPLLGIDKISENINLISLNMRVYKKVIEILGLNLKQITGLFNQSINTVTILLKNILIFIKRMNEFIKNKNSEAVEYSKYEILIKLSPAYKDYVPYFDVEGIIGFKKLFVKLIKETKKSTFLLLKTIFVKFSESFELITNITNDICEEYKDTLSSLQNIKSPKINALLQFLLSFANKPQLHFVYVNNYSIYQSLIGLLFNTHIDNQVLNTLLEFLEALLIPYHNKKITDTIENFEDTDNPYVEHMILDDESNQEEEMNMVTDEMRINNENVLIMKNFNLINQSIIQLVKNGRVKLSLKDNYTRKILLIFLYLWNVESLDGIELADSTEVLRFILKLLGDNKIYKSEHIDILTNVLRAAHLLLNANPHKNLYYNNFVHLIYKIQDSNNRLLLTLILQEFKDHFGDSKFKVILELLIYLNSKKKRRVLEDGDADNLDVDTILDKMNMITIESLQQYNIYHLEPLIYQLIVISKSDDYSIQTNSIAKIKLIYEVVLSKNTLETLTNEKFKVIKSVMYELIEYSKSVTLVKNIFDVLSFINSQVTDKIEFNDPENKYEICNDLFNIKIESEGYDFFEAIFNLKYDIRIEAIISLRETLKTKIISQFSLMKVIMPIFKIYFNPSTYSSKSGFMTYRIETQIESIISEIIECIPYLTKLLTKANLKDLIFYFFKQIEKTNKLEKQIEASELKKFTNLIYRALSKQLETLQFGFLSLYDFDNDFVRVMRRNLEEIQSAVDISNSQAGERQLTNREILSKAFNEINSTYREAQELNKHKDDIEILQLLRGKIFHLLKGMLIDNNVKEKKRFYYIRNYVIKPFFQVVKLMEPYQLKYEIIQLSYELISNLKNRDFACREHAREGIRILLDTLGPYISLILLEELKCQLHSGYQRYIMGYTCNYILNLINSYPNADDIRLILNTSIPNVMPILLDELFGDVAEEKEIEQLVKKYKEAKTTKAYHSFNIVSSRIDFKSGVVHMIYPIREFLLKKENDSTVINKANEVLNYMIKGFKNNPTVRFDDVLVISLSLVNMGIDLNLKNSKDIREHKKLQIKGNIENGEKVRKSYKEQNDERYTVQIGAPNGQSYLIEVSGKYLKEKNEIILSNLFTQLGLEIFMIAIKKKLFDFEMLRSENISETQTDIEKISLILQNVVLCLKFSNNNILVKAIKILMNLFDAKLQIVKKNLKKIVSTLFKNLNIINSNDIEISQTILSAIGEIIIKFKFYQLTETQLKILVDFLKLNINNTHIRPYIFSCLLSVIKKKIIHPSIYDMIDFIQETYITAFEENTLTVCQNVRIYLIFRF